MRSVLFVIFVLFGISYAQLDVENLDTIDDSVLREKCDSRGGKGTYANVQTARDNLQTCIEDLVDLDTIKKEIEESKKTGSMDEVFGKYCKKRPEFKKCVDKFLEKLKLCLIDDERKNLETVLNLIKELGEFACYKDGDRIAMFVAEEGPECIKAHVEGIKTCVNNTLKLSTTSTVDSLPSFLNATKVCDDLAKIQPCIVTELEICDNTTPANVVDSVFRFIRKRACKTGKQRRSIITKRSLPIAPSYLKKLINTYVKFAKSKCKGEEELQKLEEALTKTEQCVVDSAYHNALSLFNPRKVKEDVLNCTTDFVKASENCLPEDEKYFPQLSMDLMGGLIDLSLKYKRNITTSSWNPEVQQCFQSLKYQSNKQTLKKCFEGDVTQSKLGNSKEYICEQLHEFKTCVTDAITSICVQGISVDEFKEEFENLFKKPCESISSE
ncbi:uncharacterized protein LOC123313821 [Coccinella septempunctata]|uniref:uncharacterized protein LOC123313821 n=1 Tax=Coccinella septempunctata TaxID=41139 RepID=UPI001D077631|nr:uncharacterized protein LOC123313821 [Coccinella septempunctata]